MTADVPRVQPTDRIGRDLLHPNPERGTGTGPMQRILSKIFGTSNDRAIKLMLPLVDRINALEGEVSRLSDLDLRGRTTRFRERLEQGEPLDELLPEAFATVREAAKRAL